VYCETASLKKRNSNIPQVQVIFLISSFVYRNDVWKILKTCYLFGKQFHAEVMGSAEFKPKSPQGIKTHLF